MSMIVAPRILPTVIARARAEAELAPAELSAAVLDGDLVRLGDAFIPIDQPVSPADRACALLPLLGRGAIIAQLSAAWVWGATWQLQEPISSYIGAEAQTTAQDRLRAVVHEVLLTDTDVVPLDGVQITSPPRTAMDLARLGEADFDQQALGRMMGIAEVDAATVVAMLEARPRIPGRNLAIRRLQVLLTR